MSSSALLSDLTSRIADDLARSDLTTQIAAAINDAIDHYASTRFYFNETATTGSNAVTFPTVASQSLYTLAAHPSIPLFFDFDEDADGYGGVFITVSGLMRPLKRNDAATLEYLVGSNGASGDPYDWAWIDQSIRLYPIPNAVRTVTLMGAVKKAAPATPPEASNVWMTEAFELIRCHAKGLLYSHTIKDADEAGTMFQLAEMTKGRLERETSGKRSTGTIRATAF